MLGKIASTLLATLQTRLALLANELQFEEQRVLQLLWRGLALLFCLGMGVVLAVALMLALWWEQRTLLLGVLVALFFGLAAYFYAALRRNGTPEEAVFAASLAELQEDLRQLKAAAGHGNQAG